LGSQGSPLPHQHDTLLPFTYGARQPHRRSHRRGARHLAVDRPSRAPSDQINPSTIIPYPHPCLTTSPITRNWNHVGEPPWNLVGGRFFPTPAGSPPPRPATRRRQPPPRSGIWTRAHGAVLAPSPASGPSWAACRTAARAPLLGRNSPRPS
jgi:hypothetical protein